MQLQIEFWRGGEKNAKVVFFLLKFHPSASAAKFLLVITVNVPFPGTALIAHSHWFLPPQVGGCANRVHEEQGVGQVLSRAPGITQALFAPGLLPAQASAEDPQVSPTAARASVRLRLYTHTQAIHIEMQVQAHMLANVYLFFFFAYQCTNTVDVHNYYINTV